MSNFDQGPLLINGGSTTLAPPAPSGFVAPLTYHHIDNHISTSPDAPINGPLLENTGSAIAAAYAYNNAYELLPKPVIDKSHSSAISNSAAKPRLTKRRRAQDAGAFHVQAVGDENEERNDGNDKQKTSMETAPGIPASSVVDPTTGKHNAASTRRRRMVASCTECRRRKQKCDKRNPCNHCTARKATIKCHYTNEPSRYGRSNVEDSLEFIRDAASGYPTRGFLEVVDLGYSREVDANAFMGLHQLSGDDAESFGLTATLNTPATTMLRSNRLRAFLTHLPPDHIMAELVDSYFTFWNWQYSVIERHYFDDLLARWTAKEPKKPSFLRPSEFALELRFFPSLLFEVLALAMQVISPSSSLIDKMTKKQLQSARYWSDIGVELMGALGDRCCAMTAVQAGLLRVSWLKNVGRGVDSWHYLGNAIRQAQDLGIHRSKKIYQQLGVDISITLSQQWYEEYRRRVWANLVMFDAFMGLILGRPRIINEYDCDVERPLPCNIPDEPAKMMLPTLQDPIIPNTASSVLCRYELAHAIHEMRTMGADSLNVRDYHIVQQCHDTFLAILDSVPPMLRIRNPDTSWDAEHPTLSMEREGLLMMANLAITALHRRHLSSSPASRWYCLQATIVLLESQQRVFKLTPRHLWKLFQVSFYTIDASILMAYIATLDVPLDHVVRRKIDNLLYQSVDRLSLMQHCSPVAACGLQVVRRLCNRLRNTWNEMLLKAASAIAAQQVQPSTRTGFVATFETPVESTGLRDQQRQPSRVPDALIPEANNTRQATATFMSVEEQATYNDFDVEFWGENVLSQLPELLLNDLTLPYNTLQFDSFGVA